MQKQLFGPISDCYSFGIDVFPRNKDKAYWRYHEIKEGEFGWSPNCVRKFNNNEFNRVTFGIPQGGALSGLIVNIIMHSIDCNIIKSEAWGEEMLYLRYCDDMVIIHKSDKRCDELFEIYKKELEKANLDYHEPPVLKRRYHQSFWGKNVKSRNTYLWSQKPSGSRPQSKWVSFLGYIFIMMAI